MKASNLIAFAFGAGLCVGLYACGGGGNTYTNSSTMPVQPSQPTTLMLSVNDVYSRAQAQSETADPFTVTGGSVTGTDETSDPMMID
jgi:hypothetical protein